MSSSGRLACNHVSPPHTLVHTESCLERTHTSKSPCQVEAPNPSPWRASSPPTSKPTTRKAKTFQLLSHLHHLRALADLPDGVPDLQRQRTDARANRTRKTRLSHRKTPTTSSPPPRHIRWRPDGFSMSPTTRKRHLLRRTRPPPVLRNQRLRHARARRHSLAAKRQPLLTPPHRPLPVRPSHCPLHPRAATPPQPTLSQELHASSRLQRNADSPQGVPVASTMRRH